MEKKKKSIIQQQRDFAAGTKITTCQSQLFIKPAVFQELDSGVFHFYLQ